MKKFIFPLLIAVVALTSCSQALYKNKYDWVKVDHAQSTPVQDSVAKTVIAVQETPVVKAEPEKENVVPMANEKVAAKNVKVSTIFPRDSSSNIAKSKKREHKKSGIAQQSLTIHCSGGGHAFRRLFFDPSGEHNLTTEDKGYIAAGIGLLFLVILIAVLGPLTVIPVLILIAHIFMAIMAIVSFVLLIYGICWFFGHFIFMMD